MKKKKKEQNHFALGERFELPRVRVTEGKISVNVSSQFYFDREIQVTEGSSYQESTVVLTHSFLT